MSSIQFSISEFGCSSYNLVMYAFPTDQSIRLEVYEGTIDITGGAGSCAGSCAGSSCAGSSCAGSSCAGSGATITLNG